MDKKKISAIALLLFLIGLLFYLIVAPEGEQEDMDLDKTKEEVLKEINSSEEYVKNTVDWADKDTEIAYFNPPHVEESNYDPKKDVAKYFIAGLLTNDIDIFLSSFYVQTISEDLFRSKEPDKMLVTKEIMRQITRDNQLKEIKYSDKKGVFNTETNKLSLTLIYKDNKEARINLQAILLEDAHGDHEEKVYVITTSVWDIIEQIKTRIQ
ncbi:MULTISPECIES: hypothetical protein [Bacillota]|uniref:hypothetical protein n=1 Tax=Bacillota TaxID=1239 RepID=UPI0039EFCDC1